MIAKNILKRLLFTFLLALGISGAWWLSHGSDLHGEEKQIYFLLLIVNIGVCVICGLLSLTALLNAKASIASNEIYSLLSFVGLQVLFFLFLLTVFVVNDASRHRLQDFLELAVPSIVYCLALVFHYFRFQRWYEQRNKAS